MKKIWLSVIVCLGWFIGYGQTDLFFNNYQPTENAASVSSYFGINGLVYGQRQWIGIEGAPQFAGATIQVPITKQNFLGFQLHQQSLGITNELRVEVPFSQRFDLTNNSFLSMAISPKLAFASANLTAVSTVDPADEQFASQLPTSVFPNLGFSAYYNYQNDLYIGLSINEFFEHKVYYDFGFVNDPTFSVNASTLSFMAGYNWDTESKIDLGLHSNVQINHLAHFNPRLKFELTYDDFISLGISSINLTDFGSNLWIAWGDYFAMGYGYQFSNNLQYPFVSTHEIVLVYKGRDKVQKRGLKPNF